MTLRNSHRPGYKHTPIGWIPKEWRIESLNNTCSKILDGTHFSPESKDGSFKYITSKNIRNEGLDLTNISYISLVEHRNIYSRCPVKYGDILLTKDGASTGACCKNTLEEEFSLLSSVAMLRSDHTVLNSDYLLQFIKSPVGQKTITDTISGQAITRITLEKIRNYPIPLPPLPEQQKIAEILGTWDLAIETLTKLIAAKTKRKKALMQQLLSGKKRYPEFKNNKKWKKVNINEVLKEVNRQVDFDENALYDLISVRRRSGGLFHRDSLYGNQIKTKNLKTAMKGDFLISKMQIVHGASGLTTTEFDNMKISGSYISLVAIDEKKLNIELFNWLSKTPYFYHLTNISSYGVHIEKMTFNLELFMNELIFIPEIDEQNKIVTVLSTTDDEIALLNKKLQALKAQKKGLMQKLLTGEVRVKV